MSLLPARSAATCKRTSLARPHAAGITRPSPQAGPSPRVLLALVAYARGLDAA
jgi:hypothetical protein